MERFELEVIMDVNVTDRDCVVKATELECIRCAASKTLVQHKNNIVFIPYSRAQKNRYGRY